VTILDSTPIGPSPTAVAVEDTGVVWVASSAITKLSRLDPRAEAVQGVELGAKPRGLVTAFDRIWTSPAA
jgi:streptogramin lyase